MKQRILVVDDDERLCSLLKSYLEKFEYHVESYTAPRKALERLKGTIDEQGEPARIDLVVSDVMMPDLNGIAFLQEVRKFSQVPFLFLSARSEVSDKVLGLSVGADDYLPKPFEPRELEARCQAILRRATATTSTSLLVTSAVQAVPKENSQIANRLLPSNASSNTVNTSINTVNSSFISSSALELEINFAARSLYKNGEELLLTSTEFELLELLCKNAGRVVSRDEIMEQVRGIEWESYNRSVDMLVSKIRTKIGCDPKAPKYIKTIRGAGYLWIAPYAQLGGV